MSRSYGIIMVEKQPGPNIADIREEKMNAGRNERTLELLFRSLRGEELSVKALAAGFEVSTKTVNRNINFSPRVRG